MMLTGALCIVRPESDILTLLADAKANLGLTVDLPAQLIRRSNGETLSFEINEFRKHCLVNGLDGISLTLEHESEITEFEKKRSSERPWLDGIGYMGKIPLGAKKTSTDW
jgi:3-isopropylmalate dehydratase